MGSAMGSHGGRPRGISTVSEAEVVAAEEAKEEKEGVDALRVVRLDRIIYNRVHKVRVEGTSLVGEDAQYEMLVAQSVEASLAKLNQSDSVGGDGGGEGGDGEGRDGDGAGVTEGVGKEEKNGELLGEAGKTGEGKGGGGGGGGGGASPGEPSTVPETHRLVVATLRLLRNKGLDCEVYDPLLCQYMKARLPKSMCMEMVADLGPLAPSERGAVLAVQMSMLVLKKRTSSTGEHTYSAYFEGFENGVTADL